VGLDEGCEEVLFNVGVGGNIRMDGFRGVLTADCEFLRKRLSVSGDLPILFHAITCLDELAFPDFSFWRARNDLMKELCAGLSF
jgi:hypothetical protein